MKQKNRNIIAVIGVVMAAAIVALVWIALTRSFDAEGYVASVLNLTYKGEVEEAMEIMEAVTEESLAAQYEEGVTTFVKNNIISGVEINQETEQSFIELGKYIFAAMKYEVVEERETDTQQYQVVVNYNPSDVFVKYVAYIEEASKEIAENVEDGVYKGTVEEINAEIEKEFLNLAYCLLEQAYNEMEYGETQEMIFEISADETNLYHIKEADLQNFMLKIMRLDEIQD